MATLFGKAHRTQYPWDFQTICVGTLTENIAAKQRVYEHSELTTSTYWTSNAAIAKRGQTEIIGIGN